MAIAYCRSMISGSSTSPPPLGISVDDHIIVGKNGHASLKALWLI
ncbi:MAG: hypothetical protein ABI407_16925 [Bradyrhizobium sp.]